MRTRRRGAQQTKKKESQGTAKGAAASRHAESPEIHYRTALGFFPREAR